ncbi:MAG: nucleotidyltransferase domain-containing protein [Calditrichaeota bacterium]|nr:nucleotidyltransferase domain-containing protein [Calditrichota bacterium]
MADSTVLTSLNLSTDVRHIIQQFARDTKQLLHENVLEEYLFGSYATNAQTALSDIDILIVVKHLTSEIQRQISGLASDYSLEHDVFISPIIQDIGMWEKNKKYHTLFYQEVMQYGIPL